MKFEELPDDVRNALADYKRQVEESYRSEFEVQDSKLAGAKVATRDLLADLAKTAVFTLRELMEDSESDATRAKVAMYVTDKVLGKDTVLDPDDPMSELVKRLQATESE